MQRNLDQFKGDALIIGGGWAPDHQVCKPSIRTPDNFFTLDMDEKAEPDLIADISNKIDCLTIPDHKFSFIYFECFPWQNEEISLKAFQSAHRILKEDGVLIYRGGSKKSASSIPDLLKKAGFQTAFKKELDPENPKTVSDNGSFSLATDMDIQQLKEKFPQFSETIKYYLSYYKFLKKEPFSSNSIHSFNRKMNKLAIPKLSLSLYLNNFDLPEKTTNLLSSNPYFGSIYQKPENFIKSNIDLVKMELAQNNGILNRGNKIGI